MSIIDSIVLLTVIHMVINVESSSVTNQIQVLDQEAVNQLGSQIAQLHQQNKQIVLVASGAIAEGISRLGWTRRPSAMNELQAAAAVGQMGLVQAYEVAFAQ